MMNFVFLFIFHFLFFGTAPLLAQEVQSLQPLQPIEELPATEHTQHQLALLQQHILELKAKYLKLDSYIDLIFLSALTHKHLLALGGPGGSKTAVASDALQALQGRLFNLQFSPSTKEEQIKGVQKIDQLIHHALMEYATEQSLLQHQYALLDEIDKANPEVLMALLSVLHERMALVGHEKILGKLQTAIITSNMHLGEFMAKFLATGDGASAKAILDRIHYKIFIPNRMPEAEDLYQIFAVPPLPLSLTTPTINLAGITHQLAQLELPMEVQKLTFYLWQRLTKVLEKKQYDCSAVAPAASSYTMTQQFTTRQAGHIFDTLKAAKFLAELQKSPDKNFDWEQLTWDPSDLQYAEAAMILQGPGQDREEDREEEGEGEGEGDSAGGLEGYKDIYEFDPRTLNMLEDLEFERESFKQVKLEILKEYQEEIQRWTREISQLDSSPLHPTADISLLQKEILRVKDSLSAKDHSKDSYVQKVAQEKVLSILNGMQKKYPIIHPSTSTDETKKITLQKEEEKEKEAQRQQSLVEEARKKKALEHTTTTGAIFTQINDPAYRKLATGSAWQDPGGRIWIGPAKYVAGQILKLNYYEAKEFCAYFKARLARIDEYKELREYFGHDDNATLIENEKNYTPQIFLKDVHGWLWAARAKKPANNHEVYDNVYSTDKGEFKSFGKDYRSSYAICVK